jgi:hypothetical protein
LVRPGSPGMARPSVEDLPAQLFLAIAVLYRAPSGEALYEGHSKTDCGKALYRAEKKYLRG